MKIVLIVFLLLINVNAESSFGSGAQEDSSSYIISLKDVILSTQKTRGLTNSYLSGNAAALPLLEQQKKEMKQAIEQMTASPLNSDPLIKSYSVSLSQALTKLNDTALQMNPGEAFESYTDEIAKIIKLAKTISLRSTITLSPLGQETIALMTKVLLPMVEYIGQIRGIGSGIAAKKKITEEEKEKILALSTKVHALQKKLQERMQSILSAYSNAYNTDTGKAVEHISNKIQKYMNIAEKTLVSAPESIDPTQYFEQGTGIINMLVKLNKINNRAALNSSKIW